LGGIPRSGADEQPGADVCASVPRDLLGIRTDAILVGERDSGAIGRQNAKATSDPASHLGGSDDHPCLYRRASAPVCHPGRPAAPWRRRRRPQITARVVCRAIADLIQTWPDAIAGIGPIGLTGRHWATGQTRVATRQQEETSCNRSSQLGPGSHAGPTNTSRVSPGGATAAHRMRARSSTTPATRTPPATIRGAVARP